MTTDTTRTTDSIVRITFGTDAGQVAIGAYRLIDDLLASLTADEWEAVTECAPWTVADMVGHLIGAGRSNASMREQARQVIHGRRHAKEFGGNDLDAMNDLQVRDHRHLRPQERIEALRAIAPKAVKGRMSTPRPLRGVRLSLAPGGSTAEGMPDSFTLGNLNAVVYTRDVWLHRVDIARAAGRTLDHDNDVERRIIEDVVAEWAAEHGQPFELELTGPAGGRFRQGTGGERISMDAVEFCRTLSGRAPAEGLLATRVLF